MPAVPKDSIGQLLSRASARLAALEDSDPRLEAEILLAHLLKKPRSHLYAWPDRIPDPSLQQAFSTLLEQRLAGQPLAYLTGVREFWSLPLRVTPATLIPRADTERLVERALELIPAAEPWQIADLGTGSGAIAAAIARERPACRILATDLDQDALAVARDNLRRLGLENASCRAGSWCRALPPDLAFDLIVANPPYIAADDPHLQHHGLDREPRGALVSGSDGLDDIRHIASQAPAHLKPGSRLLLEHGFDQASRVGEILRQAGFRHIRSHRDLAGNPRITEGMNSR